MDNTYGSLIKAYGNRKIHVEKGMDIPVSFRSERPVFDCLDAAAVFGGNSSLPQGAPLLAATPYDDFAVIIPLYVKGAPSGIGGVGVLWVERFETTQILRIFAHPTPGTALAFDPLSKQYNGWTLLPVITYIKNADLVDQWTPYADQHSSQALGCGETMLGMYHHFLAVLLRKPRIEYVSVPDPVENSTRARLGKAQLPHIIRLNFTDIREVWGQPQRQHASPVPHDRRGHARTLKSGRVVRVRPCKIKGGSEDAPTYVV